MLLRFERFMAGTSASVSHCVTFDVTSVALRKRYFPAQQACASSTIEFSPSTNVPLFFKDTWEPRDAHLVEYGPNSSRYRPYMPSVYCTQNKYEDVRSTAESTPGADIRRFQAHWKLQKLQGFNNLASACMQSLCFLCKVFKIFKDL